MQTIVTGLHQGQLSLQGNMEDCKSSLAQSSPDLGSSPTDSVVVQKQDVFQPKILVHDTCMPYLLYHTKMMQHRHCTAQDSYHFSGRGVKLQQRRDQYPHGQQEGMQHALFSVKGCLSFLTS